MFQSARVTFPPLGMVSERLAKGKAGANNTQSSPSQGHQNQIAPDLKIPRSNQQQQETKSCFPKTTGFWPNSNFSHFSFLQFKFLTFPRFKLLAFSNFQLHHISRSLSWLSDRQCRCPLFAPVCIQSGENSAYSNSNYFNSNFSNFHSKFLQFKFHKLL